MTESEASTLTITPREPGKDDREVTAIFAIVSALKPLKEDEVRNVLEYVLRRFGAGPLPIYAASQTPRSELVASQNRTGGPILRALCEGWDSTVAPRSGFFGDLRMAGYLSG
jgi:hypothetical protein